MTPITSARAFRKPVPFVPANFAFQDLSEVNLSVATECTGLLLIGKYPPFLPRNFYEAPQYASFRPTSAITLDVPATTTPPALLSIPAVGANSILPSRKTLRTFSTLFNDEGRLAGAKINLSTGEIVEHNYKNYFEQGPKARRKPDAPDIEPFWMKSVEERTDGAVTAAANDSKKKRGQPPKVHPNSLKPYLAAFSAPGFALAGLPFLDKIVTGAVNLDMDNNTRASAKKLAVSLLQRLDFISSQGVRDYMHLTLRTCCVRHSQKIATYLRVIETAAAPIAKTLWPAPLAYEIDPCGRENCSVCTRSATEVRTSDTHSHDYADGDSAVEFDNWSDSD
jgi:hypothetical protein